MPASFKDLPDQNALFARRSQSTHCDSFGLRRPLTLASLAQDEIAAAISKGSVDTLARQRNCDAGNVHPESQVNRISLRKVFDVSKVTTTLSVPIDTKSAKPSPPIPDPLHATTDDPTTTAMAARRGVKSPPRPPRPKPPPVIVPPIKPAAPLPLSQKPLWSPSALNNEKASAPVSVSANTPEIDLEKEIEKALKNLARQSDTYHKLRAKLRLDSRDDVISAREITKALADLGLKLGAAGIAVMMRRVSATEVGEDTPPGLDAKTLRAYLLKLKLNKNIDWNEWAAQKKEQKEKATEARNFEFQKALAGLDFNLEDSEFEELISGFNIVPDDVLKKEIHARAVEWLGSAEGVRTCRKNAADSVLRGGSNVCDEEDKNILLRQGKQDALEEKRKTMSAGEFREKDSSDLTGFFSVTKSMFKEYITMNRRQHFVDTIKFSEWCEEREKNRIKVREARKEWMEGKNRMREEEIVSGNKVAPVADVEEKIKVLVAAAQQQTTIGQRGDIQGVPVLKPSRKGIDLAKKLKELQRLSGEGKIVSKAAFDEVMADVMFSLMADKKTAKQAKVYVRERSEHISLASSTTTHSLNLYSLAYTSCSKRLGQLYSNKHADKNTPKALPFFHTDLYVLGQRCMPSVCVCVALSSPPINPRSRWQVRQGVHEEGGGGNGQLIFRGGRGGGSGEEGALHLQTKEERCQRKLQGVA